MSKTEGQGMGRYLLAGIVLFAALLAVRALSSSASLLPWEWWTKPVSATVSQPRTNGVNTILTSTTSPSGQTPSNPSTIPGTVEPGQTPESGKRMW